ncbi:hypothetical protein AQUCO_01000621v1 [Aquilegia coerulea]|uniref:Uncharacterized protein n=1 Tax=Aquilegia coerulea TaxID=218851 RepID=A0A2G5EAT2_AQUCA|nr:hypothetical protein AQUCO_01000621v1 [Aquilegia coerulea]
MVQSKQLCQPRKESKLLAVLMNPILLIQMKNLKAKWLCQLKKHLSQWLPMGLPRRKLSPVTVLIQRVMTRMKKRKHLLKLPQELRKFQ